MRYLITTIALFFSLISCKDRVENRVLEIPTKDSVKTVEDREVSLIFVGDVMAHAPQISGAKVDSAENSYDFSGCFRYIAPYWKSADFVIANLETTLAADKFSGYPCFSAPYSLVDALKSSGVTHFVLANNHTCDKYSKGITSTTDYLDKIEIPYIGAHQDSSSFDRDFPLYIKKDGFNIALLNYTYGTNGMPIPNGMVVPHLDTTEMARDIEKCKRGFATNIIAFLHWGYEYNRTESLEQRKIANWLEEKGVDIIIGSHPHVVQPIVFDKNSIKVFSLGNFISNQRKRYTNGGINVKITIRKGDNGVKYETSYRSFYVCKTKEKPRYFCLDSLSVDSVIIEDFELKMAHQFFDDTNKLLRK